MLLNLLLAVVLMLELNPGVNGRQVKANQGGPSLTGACRDMNDQLQAAFRCRPNDFQQKGVCEGERLELRCPPMEHIVILSAEFGRTRSMCAAGSATDCPMTCVDDVIRRHCDVKRRCKLVADEKTLGRPCVSRGHKYLTVVHTCVPKATAKSIAANKWTFEEERCEPSSVFIDPVKPPLDGATLETSTIKSVAEVFTTRPPPLVTTRQIFLAGGGKVPPETGLDSVRVVGRDNLWEFDDGGTDSLDDEDEGDTVKAEEFEKSGKSMKEWERESVVDSHVHQAPPAIQPYNTTVGYTLSTSVSTTTEMSRSSTRSSTAVRRASNDKLGHAGPFHFMTDWISTARFVSDNREKLILYSVLSVCIGIIAVLLSVVARLTCHPRSGRYTPNSAPASGPSRRFRGGKPGQGSSEAVDRPLTSMMGSPPGWRMPDSSSSVAGCDRSIGEEDVEMMSFNRLDSLHRAACPQHQQLHQNQQQLQNQQLHQNHQQVQNQQQLTLSRQNQQNQIQHAAASSQQQQWTNSLQQPLLISQKNYQLSTLPLQSRHQQLQIEVPKSTATINRSFNGQMNAAVNRIGIPPPTLSSQQNGSPSPMYANGPNYSATMPLNGKIPHSNNITTCSAHLNGGTPPLNGKPTMNGGIPTTSLGGNNFPPPPPLSTANGGYYHGFGISGYTLPGERMCSVHSRPTIGANRVGHSPGGVETRGRAGSLSSDLYSSIRGDPFSPEDSMRTLQPLVNTTSLRA